MVCVCMGSRGVLVCQVFVMRKTVEDGLSLGVLGGLLHTSLGLFWKQSSSPWGKRGCSQLGLSAGYVIGSGYAAVYIEMKVRQRWRRAGEDGQSPRSTFTGVLKPLTAGELIHQAHRHICSCVSFGSVTAFVILGQGCE